jgi:DNA-binding transcriptional MerR regulator
MRTLVVPPTRLWLSEACRMFGLTPRAVRYYEDRGLVNAQRDRLNHRYYDSRARRQLRWIADLRAVGLPVAEIREVLDADEDGEGASVALEKLAARAKALQAELRCAENLAKRLRRPSP